MCGSPFLGLLQGATVPWVGADTDLRVFKSLQSRSNFLWRQLIGNSRYVN